MTLSELLYSKMYRGNQSLLSRELGVNRGTLTKYLKDADGNFHHVNEVNGEFVLFAKVGGKA